MTPSFAIGIDIGGTNTKYGMVNQRGEILYKGSISTTGYRAVGDFVLALQHALAPLIEKGGKESIAGIGIGAPNGNIYTGEIVFAPNLPWHGVIPLAKLVSTATGLKTTLTNDANAAAIGEMTYGRARGLKDFILVTLGTGLGSGFVANGQLIYGHDGFAGELGHIIAVREGRQCGCGRKGCLETYASATGIVRSFDEFLPQYTGDSILKNSSTGVTAKMIHHAADQGDAFALELFDFTAKILGQSLADAVAITSPEAIIFFGGLARSGDLLLIPTKKYMEENLLPIYRNKVALLQSALPDSDAAILGASALVW